MTTQDTTVPQPDSRARTFAQLEDMTGKFVLLVFFFWLFSNSARAIIACITQPVHDFTWALTLVSHVSSLAFVTLVVGLTVLRKPAVDVQPGWEARVSSFLGTFILLTLIGIPRAEVGEAQALVATVLIILGTVSSIWCLWWLGRAFAVMAAARDLVTSGPYAHVRHPLYTAEAITVVGVILINGSLMAVLVGALQFYFQYRRILNEESVLERAFDGYGAYKARTPMILPRLF